MGLSTLDIIVFGPIVSCSWALVYGCYATRRDTRRMRKIAFSPASLTAIGASLIAANISAEQFIGMSGPGFAIGLALASYE
jgi:solute:Na+ symporter, SSS family